MKSMYEVPIVNVEHIKNFDKDILYKYAKENKKPLNLHLGCGAKKFDDYINIDLYNISEGRQIKPDLNLDIRDIDKFTKPNSINKILIVHVLEHFNRWEVVELLKSFYICLKPSGILEIEMPDLDGAIDFYINKRGKPYRSPIGKINRGRVQFYGDQWSKNEHGTHKYLWTKDEIKEELENIGFNIIRLDNSAKFHIKKRDMYIVLKK